VIKASEADNLGSVVFMPVAYVALNPTRNDRRPGSFKINIRMGRWCDFAAGDQGGDPVSLVAYL
jgi:hypothetical protein